MNMVTIPPAVVSECKQFEDPSGRPVAGRTIVITPLRVTFTDEHSYKISFGCNYWLSCQNKACSYCQAGMDRGY